jgi:NADPH:quinone reductase-like Zn-dependent oxidoreductase
MNLAGTTVKGLVLGHDFAGTVEEIGPDVPSGLRKIGERVAGFINGCELTPLIVTSYPLYHRRCEHRTWGNFCRILCGRRASFGHYTR